MKLRLEPTDLGGTSHDAPSKEMTPLSHAPAVAHPLAGRRAAFVLLLIIFLAALLRVGALVAVGLNKTGFGDAEDYVAAARSVCHGDGYPSAGNLPFFRAPGLPLAISALTLCNTDELWRAKIVLAIVDALLAGLLFVLARTMTSDLRTGIVAASLVAVHPGFVIQVTDVRSEPLFTVLLIGSLCAVYLGRVRSRASFYGLAGSLAALAALTRPVGLVAVAFVAAAGVAEGRAGTWTRRVCAALIGAALTLAPWVTYMAAKHRELILINDAGGYNMWRGAHPELYRALASRDVPTYRALALDFELRTSPAEARDVASVAVTPMARSREWRRRAIALLRADPRMAVKYAAYKAAVFWRPWLNPLEYPRVVVLGSGIFNCAVYLLACVGFVLLAKQHRDGAYLLAAWSLLFWVAHVPFQVVSRFRTATVDPVLLVLCAVALTRAWEGQLFQRTLLRWRTP